MNGSFDIGYNATKVVGSGVKVSFPSIVGSPDRARFGIGDQDFMTIKNEEGKERNIGEGAIAQSRFTQRREDRDWYQSEEYKFLILAAFAKLTEATQLELNIVTGLPVAFYEKDKDSLREKFLGDHRFTVSGRRAQVVKVLSCRVIPQPFGTVFSEAMDHTGSMIDKKIYENKLGVIDVGGKTTNLLSVNRMSEVFTETASVNTGGWNLVRALRDGYLNEKFPDLDLKDHEIVEAITKREINYFGEPYDLSVPIRELSEELSIQIIATATQLWKGGSGLSQILITGGGAVLLGQSIKTAFKHARIVADPIYANAIGYYNFCTYHAEKGK